MAVPYTFGSATTSIPLSQLDSNFATAITLGNTAVQLGNTITTLTGVTNVASSGSLTLGTSGNTTAVTIDTSQNVLVGVTSSAAGRLAVKDVAGSGNNLWLIGRSSDGTSSVSFRNNADSAYNARIECFDTGTMTFATGTSATERMRIDSSGNLLVGATSYAGSGLSLGSPNGSGSYSIIAAAGTGFHWRFGNVTNGVVGSISTTTTTTTFAPTSDRRLKENIEPIKNALEKVALLKPVTYNWKADGSSDDGFIAQDIKDIPFFAHRCTPIGERNGEEYYGVDYMRFVSVLTAAIQELKAEFDAYKATHS